MVTKSFISRKNDDIKVIDFAEFGPAKDLLFLPTQWPKFASTRWTVDRRRDWVGFAHPVNMLDESLPPPGIDEIKRP